MEERPYFRPLGWRESLTGHDQLARLRYVESTPSMGTDAPVRMRSPLPPGRKTVFLIFIPVHGFRRLPA